MLRYTSNSEWLSHGRLLVLMLVGCACAEQSPVVPQRRLTDCGQLSAKPWRDSRVLVQLTGAQGIVISGTDDARRKWIVTIASEGGGCEVYGGDVDLDGMEDLIVVTFPASASGDLYFHAITFDRDGQPLAMRARGLFTADCQGVCQLVRRKVDGRPELVVRTAARHGYSVQRYGAWSGFWRRTDKGSVPQGREIAAQSIAVADLTNDYRDSPRAFCKRVVDPGPAGRVSLRAETSTDGSRTAAVGDAAAFSIELDDGRRLSMPSIIVVSEAGSRSIAIENADRERLIREAVGKGLVTVRRAGSSCSSLECWPHLLFFETPGREP